MNMKIVGTDISLTPESFVPTCIHFPQSLHPPTHNPMLWFSTIVAFDPSIVFTHYPSHPFITSVSTTYVAFPTHGRIRCDANLTNMGPMNSVGAGRLFSPCVNITEKNWGVRFHLLTLSCLVALLLRFLHSNAFLGRTTSFLINSKYTILFIVVLSRCMIIFIEKNHDLMVYQ